MPDAESLRAAGQALTIRTGADGSFSLWSDAFGEGFHSRRGALREARETFLNPSHLERFQPGSTLRVLEVCVGTGCNLAVLLEACAAAGLRLDWTGLELDPAPLRLALGQPAFRAPWQPCTLQVLEQLLERGAWRGGDRMPAGERADGAADGHFGASLDDLPVLPMGRLSERASDLGKAPPHGVSTRLLTGRGRMLWGDARRTLAQLQHDLAGPLDLIWHDAFSPQRCPQLWSVEFLTPLTGLLGPQGRWISYSSAAAVREALRLAGRQLAALQVSGDASSHPGCWSGGTVASPAALPPSPLWRQLTAMEWDHLASSAGEPYRDPGGEAPAAEILRARAQAQALALAEGSRGSSSAWRRRWGVEVRRPPG